MDFTSLGMGGIIGAFISHWLDNKKDLNIKLNQINEDKYRTILIHMSCALDINNRKYFSIKKDYEDNNTDYYLHCVKEYYYHSLLYSPDFVVKDLKMFIEDPSKESFVKVAKSMRKDLWGKKSKLGSEELLLKNKDNK